MSLTIKKKKPDASVSSHLSVFKQRNLKRSNSNGHKNGASVFVAIAIGWSTLRMLTCDVMNEVQLPAPNKSSGCPDVNSPDVIIKYEVVRLVKKRNGIQ